LSTWKYRLGGLAGHAVLTSLLSTCRYSLHGTEHHDPATDGPVVYALWHGRMLPAAFYHRHRGLAALISLSADGEYIARVVSRWGYIPVRGSSSRRGEAGLRELVAQARAGRSIVFTPDGPRGPFQTMKPGALRAARETGLPIVPVSAAADRGWWFGTWDRFLVPKPFAAVRVAYGPKHVVPPDASGEALEDASRRLETALTRLTEELDAVAR
jgi:lysophospholipid acyltransferase (LPLAT)-like uncharacterized protein